MLQTTTSPPRPLATQSTQPCTTQQQHAHQRPDTSRMGQSSDHVPPAQPTRRSLGMAEPVADSHSDLESPEDTSPTFTTNQAGPTLKSQVSILETEYNHFNLLPLTWADDGEDIKDRSESAMADPNRPPHPPTPAITAAGPTVAQAATRSKLTPLSLPITGPDPWVISHVSMHINRSPLPASPSTMVTDRLTRSSRLLAAHGFSSRPGKHRVCRLAGLGGRATG